MKKTIELVGAENVLMMTDSVESKKMVGRHLHTRQGSTLLYQDDGIVAAGSQGATRQIANMLAAGIVPKDVQLITGIVPMEILKKRNEFLKKEVSSEITCI